MKKWNDILESAQEFVDFLERDTFFDKPFVNTINALVISDPLLGFKYANQDDEVQSFPAWESISRGEYSFPDSFELYGYVGHQLLKNNFFNIQSKNFSGFNELWDSTMAELITDDMYYIFQCYANNYFPPLWKDILTAYLNNGLPCGWSDFPPKGKLVVFSNELLEP
ncbi:MULTISPECIES: hypothetical protein [Gammaproteobacteria]|uniref:hypothetical protein n=1 Tax=Gammaproteobacteria TaxID=1236 RepID=UPI001787C567|nr:MULTISPECIES: hypothetical protein [unclassified Psychrobacter]MBE0441136.1 hypothetical protein [Psychrobacter sp. FME13]